MEAQKSRCLREKDERMNVIFRNSTRRLVTPFGAFLKNDLRYTGLFWASMTYMTYTIATIPLTEQDLADSPYQYQKELGIAKIKNDKEALERLSHSKHAHHH
eukprot:CAMPEP_0114616256 /NCGR_PEP_ID=MMETSP0168-20121206/6592_1 /TAXON_ID=95228 ORGANISM="Vannella sp., Strain DIVA3 517/6/12" /NCGR_SAMPLE_ID=MMETSP0168 /ASSEMBLY_ACC=CAM_ASM_000044 /LENGTH=101 /DNA_ID=CAMNT_0001827363 /DNA_START=19 /DNA_END=324 /DNA_ORIENTATION=-